MQKSGVFSNISISERKFVNKFGNNIKEDIIIADKSSEPVFCTNNGKYIALKHLEQNLSLVEGEIAFAIEDAIKNIDQISQSPLFNPTNIIVHDRRTI
jgi:hypothetical protein